MRAEGRSRARKSGDGSIDRVEKHPDEHEATSEGKRGKSKGALVNRFRGIVNRCEATNHITEGEQCWEHAGSAAAAAGAFGEIAFVAAARGRVL